MDINHEYLPDINNIVDSLRKGHLALFCGAGATADATNATWLDLFREELKVIDKDVNDYYKLAEYYKLHFGKSKLINTVTNLFSEYKPSKHIMHLLKLPVYEFWTTNFDCIIENMIEENTGVMPSVIYNSSNIIKINENKKYRVFKLNGSITDGDSMILTATDYDNYKYKQALLIEFLKRELVLNTFLFIGYSFDDNLVLSCLREIKQCFPTLDYYHYRLEKRSNKHAIFQKIEAKYFEDNYNIKTIFVNSYDEIDDFIEHIYARFTERNVFISGSFRNLSRDEEDNANLLCKVLVHKLIDEGFNIYSGDGKRLGSYILTNATRKMMDENIANQNRLVIMPYIDHSFKTKKADDVDRVNLVRRMINDCSAAIFLYGQSETGEASPGAIVEYNEAQMRNMLTIPIPSTGFAAKQIYDSIIENNTPGYLERYIHVLSEETDPERIAQTIIEILKANSM